MKIRVSAVFCFVFSGILKIAFSARLTTMGENWKALRTVFFLSKTSDLLGGTVKNTGRLPRMLPVIFRELSWTIFRFTRVVVWLFVHIASYEDMMISHQEASKIPYLWPQFWQSYFWPSGENRLATPKIKLRLWKNGKLFNKALGKLRGASWRESSHGRGAAFLSELLTWGAQYLIRNITPKNFVRTTRPTILCANL